MPNPLIIGDLNAYTEEDPIHVLEDAGYTGLSEEFIGDDQRYSFVFDGFSGELDHGLASAGPARQRHRRRRSGTSTPTSR